jgi:hypothetical protein
VSPDEQTVRIARKQFVRRQWARRWLAWRRILVVLVSLAVLVGTVWLVFFSSVLTVKGVQFEGLDVLLFQVSVSRAAYRAMYNEEFISRKMRGSNPFWREDSILPVVDWVKNMIADFKRELKK